MILIMAPGLSVKMNISYTKKHSSNANDFGVSAKYRNKEVELTYRGSTSNFLFLNVIAKKKGGDAFVRQIPGIKNYTSRATILHQDTPLLAKEFDVEKQSLKNTSREAILHQDTPLLSEDIERQS